MKYYHLYQKGLASYHLLFYVFCTSESYNDIKQRKPQIRKFWNKNLQIILV